MSTPPDSPPEGWASIRQQPTPCTDEQKAEWSELHDRAHAAYEAVGAAEASAARFLIDHVDEGAMTPGPLGVPSSEALRSYELACEAAIQAKRLRVEWRTLSAEAKAHPYTAEVQARA